MEYTLKDSNGVKVIQAEIHREIQDHIDECKRRNEKYCGILAPWGHGKTEQAIIGRGLKEIGENPNIRIILLTNTDDNSKSRVASLTKYILHDEDYHRIYPNVKPAQGEDWSKHKIIVSRESKSKDGTVEAYGVTTSGTGARCDLLLCDDIIDQRNAISNPALRPAVKDNFNNVWLSRLTPDGMVIYIATVWHQDDNTAEIMVNPEWKFLVMKISEDFKHIECESAFKGSYRIPVWDYWNEDALKSRFKVIGKRAFNRGFRQQALSDEDRTFPSSDLIFRKDLDLGSVRADWPRVMGIDPFGQAVVLFTIAVNPVQHTRFVIDVRRGKWSPTRTIDEMIRAYHEHKHQIIVCENNASQEAIVQWATEREGIDFPVVPFTTGKQKADPAMGLPSLEVEFANGAWIVPCKHIDETDNEHPINVWRKELAEHPLSEKEDTVMASWFAREAARYLTIGPIDNSNDIATAQDFGVEAIPSIGDYD